MVASVKHTLVALVEDKPGVLNRAASLFRRRGFNIESIAVGHSEIRGLSRMTLVVDGANTAVEQVEKQLYKLVDVVKVSRLNRNRIVTREMALIKVHTVDTKVRSDVINYADIFRARVIDVSSESLIMEITGTSEKIDAFLDLMKPFGVMEIARTGITALSRGVKSVRVE